MTDLPPRPDNTGADAEPDDEATSGTPRWVYGFLIVAVVLIVLFIILHVSGVAPWGHSAP